MEKRGGLNMVESTLKWTSVLSTEVEKAKYRLEANVFNIDARAAYTTLNECKYPSVGLWSSEGLIKSAFYPGRFKRVYVAKGCGFPMILPSQMTEIKPRETKFISIKTAKSIGNLEVKLNTLLVTRSGTIGNCTIVSETLKGLTMSDDIIRIEFKNEYDLGFTYAFLKTKVGRLILATNNYGSVIQHIEPEHLENVPIPTVPENIKKGIHDKIMRSFSLRDESNVLIDKAEKLMVEALKLPDIESLKPDFYKNDTDVQTFIVKLNLLNDRFDGSYHIPLAEKIIDCLLESGATITPLGRLSNKITMPGIFKRVYVADIESGVPFLGTSDILELSPNVEKFLSKKHHKTLIQKELAVKKNMVLITDRGTIGNTILVPRYYEELSWTVSQNIIRVQIDDKLAGYLYIFLQSPYGKALVKRETYGAVIDMIDPENAKNIPIPILKDKAIAKNINDLALKANDLRSEAYYLEQAAIKQINEEVIFVSKNNTPSI
jgi:type I restriction enzyme S subunit